MVFLRLIILLCVAVKCYAISVGDIVGGGTAICVSQTSDMSLCKNTGSGLYALIMANADQANYNSNSNYGITWSSTNGAVGAQSIIDGASNTATIISADPSDISSVSLSR